MDDEVEAHRLTTAKPTVAKPSVMDDEVEAHSIAPKVIVVFDEEAEVYDVDFKNIL
jgi:hypothetical protein